MKTWQVFFAVINVNFLIDKINLILYFNFQPKGIKMEILSEHSGEHYIIRVAGGITSATVSEFDSKLREQITSSPDNLIVSLSDVNYINSSGLRVILTIAKDYSAKKLNFSVQCKRDIYQIFETVGFHKIIKFLIIE